MRTKELSSNCSRDFLSQWQHGRSWNRPWDPSVKSGFGLEKQTESTVNSTTFSWMPDLLPLWNCSPQPSQGWSDTCAAKKWPYEVETPDRNTKATFLPSPKDPDGKVISSIALECPVDLTADMCLPSTSHYLLFRKKKKSMQRVSHMIKTSCLKMI